MITYKVTVDEYKTVRWYLNDKFHREDGPAMEFADGSKAWYKNGERHREDGPAMEFADGSKYWYLDGRVMSEEEHAKRTAKTQELTVAEIEKLLGHKVKIVK